MKKEKNTYYTWTDEYHIEQIRLGCKETFLFHTFINAGRTESCHVSQKMDGLKRSSALRISESECIEFFNRVKNAILGQIERRFRSFLKYKILYSLQTFAEVSIYLINKTKQKKL